MAALSGKGQVSVHVRNEEKRGRGRAVKEREPGEECSGGHGCQGEEETRDDQVGVWFSNRQCLVNLR